MRNRNFVKITRKLWTLGSSVKLTRNAAAIFVRKLGNEFIVESIFQWSKNDDWPCHLRCKINILLININQCAICRWQRTNTKPQNVRVRRYINNIILIVGKNIVCIGNICWQEWSLQGSAMVRVQLLKTTKSRHIIWYTYYVCMQVCMSKCVHTHVHMHVCMH